MINRNVVLTAVEKRPKCTVMCRATKKAPLYFNRTYTRKVNEFPCLMLPAMHLEHFMLLVWHMVTWVTTCDDDNTEGQERKITQQ
jgi:hypothetical protein